MKKAWSDVENWAKPEKLPFSIQWGAFRPAIRKEPKGVVLIIGPFNYPLWSTLTPLVRTLLVSDHDVYLVYITGRGHRCGMRYSHQAIGRYPCDMFFARRAYSEVHGLGFGSCGQWWYP